MRYLSLKETVAAIGSLFAIDPRWQMDRQGKICWMTGPPLNTTTVYHPKATTTKIVSPCHQHILNLTWLTRWLLPRVAAAPTEERGPITLIDNSKSEQVAFDTKYQKPEEAEEIPWT